MLNPEITKMFDNTNVVEALSIFANLCESKNTYVGVYHTGYENDVLVPKALVTDVRIPTDIHLSYIDILYSRIEEDAESCNGLYLTKKSLTESELKEVVPLWVNTVT